MGIHDLLEPVQPPLPDRMHPRVAARACDDCRDCPGLITIYLFDSLRRESPT
jgi:hypothetical protein